MIMVGEYNAKINYLNDSKVQPYVLKMAVWLWIDLILTSIL
jgi:hypothetical protein